MADGVIVLYSRSQRGGQDAWISPLLNNEDEKGKGVST
jgi:hypothetical protein